MTITVELIEFVKHAGDVIQRVGALGMTGNLDHLPGGEISVDGLGKAAGLFPQLVDFIRDIQLIIITNQLQFFDFRLKIGNGLLKIQIVQIHAWLQSCRFKSGEIGINRHLQKISGRCPDLLPVNNDQKYTPPGSVPKVKKHSQP